MSYEVFAALVRSGVPVPQAWLEADVEQRQNAQLLGKAIQLGAPLDAVAQLLARLERLDQEQQLHIDAAQAVPRLSSKLMLLLPPIGLGVGELLGLGNLSSLTTTPGLIAAISALALSYLATQISARLVQRGLQLPELDQSLLELRLKLMAGQGLAEVQAEMSERSVELIELSQRTGAALGDLLQSEIEQQVVQRGLVAQRKAQELSVLLVLPLGLLALPAFLIFALSPILIGITK